MGGFCLEFAGIDWPKSVDLKSWLLNSIQFALNLSRYKSSLDCDDQKFLKPGQCHQF